MTATADPSDRTLVQPPAPSALARAEGVELLGDVHGSGYKEGAALVRRADGQMVHLGPLMYGLLEEMDGRRSNAELAQALCERLGRGCDEEHVVAIAQKLAAQGLIAGTEHQAPPRRNPLLALRWKVLVTDPGVTSRLTAPFAVLFRPWLMWPILACFAAVVWFVLIHKGVASATADAFHSPGLLLLVFVLAVASAGFHELGHAAACRYGGATPGGMGMGLYMVWPAFYTDVTDTYRLPKRDRLRVDLGGLYFNCVVAVATMAVWLAWHVDALLLLVALQLLQMVKQLSPVIRADGYHILADWTGVPDLYSHMLPTLRGLLPWRHEPSALKGRARLVVTLWVLIIVPVLLALTLTAVLLLPRLLTTAWDSGRQIVEALPHQGALGVLASLVHLLALALPVLGSVLVAQKILRGLLSKAEGWSAGSPVRRSALVAVATAAAAGAAWAWWPAGQYQPVRAADAGTLTGFRTLIASPASVARPQTAPTVLLTPGTHLAVAMIPVGGASQRHPAFYVVPGKHGRPAVALVSTTAPAPTTAGATTGTPNTTTTTDVTTTTEATTTTAEAATTTAPAATTTTPPTPTTTGASQPPAPAPAPAPATAFPFKLPAAPGPGGTQAVAVGTKDGAVTYDVAYALVTVSKGAPVTNTNAAYALASCKACTTVAVSFQLVLIVGTSKVITPINAAGALNVNCPACVTTAIADQIVVTLTKQPSQELVAKLESELKQLDALPSLGADGTPAAVAAQVAAVQQQLEDTLNGSGLLPATTTAATTTNGTTTTAPTTSTATTPATGTSPAATTTAATATTPAATTTSSASPSTTPAATTTGATHTATAPATTTAPAATTTAPATTTATTTAPTATATTPAVTTTAAVTTTG